MDIITPMDSAPIPLLLVVLDSALSHSCNSVMIAMIG